VFLADSLCCRRSVGRRWLLCSQANQRARVLRSPAIVVSQTQGASVPSGETRAQASHRHPQRHATCGLQQRLFARRATIVVMSSARSPLFSLCVGAGLTCDTTAEPRAADRNMEHGAPLYCKPRTTSHDCSAGMTNTSDYFRAQITHLYIHTTIHSYMRPYTTTTPCLHIYCVRPGQSSSVLHTLPQWATQHTILSERLRLGETSAMNVPLHYQPDATPGSLTQPRLSLAEHYHPSVQQAYGPYGIGDISTLVHQTQYQAGQAAALRFHMQQLCSLSTVPPSQAQHKAHSHGDGQGAVVFAPAFAPAASFATIAGPPSSMGPSTQSRKREAPLSVRLTGSRTKPAS
jgi:hypothetical protein